MLTVQVVETVAGFTKSIRARLLSAAIAVVFGHFALQSACPLYPQADIR
jgi:hypothetical protein